MFFYGRLTKKKWHIYVPPYFFPSTGKQNVLRVCVKKWWKFRNAWGSLSRQEENYMKEESFTSTSTSVSLAHTHTQFCKNKDSDLNRNLTHTHCIWVKKTPPVSHSRATCLHVTAVMCVPRISLSEKRFMETAAEISLQDLFSSLSEAFNHVTRLNDWWIVVIYNSITTGQTASADDDMI